MKRKRDRVDTFIAVSFGVVCPENESKLDRLKLLAELATPAYGVNGIFYAVDDDHALIMMLYDCAHTHKHTYNISYSI